jgi:ABC-2 type transport system ATP-binding protein
MSDVLSITELRKEYGDTVAVDVISFQVGRNEIVGLLGPNGAGTTTTINMILGVVQPSSGGIRVEGVDLAAHRCLALERTNFAAVYSPLLGNLTVSQNLRIFGLIYGVDNLSERIEELLKRFDLVTFRDVKCGVLSSGEQTRAALAKAMLNRPHLLLLDEPTASLDPSVARDIRSRIRSHTAQGAGGVLWTSHNNRLSSLLNRGVQ